MLELKKKICFGITKLGIGGAERVLVDFANMLSTYYDITIFTIYGGGELEKELNPQINLKTLYDKEKKNTLIPLYVLLCGKRIYNRFLKGKYDVNIAFLEGPITRIFCYGNDEAKKVAWVHNDISKVFGNSIKARIKRYIDKFYYNKYDKIIFVSKQNKEAFEEVYGDISKREVIYNYIDKERVIKMSNVEIKDKIKIDKEICILTISRLVKQKAIDRLIRVHKRLIDEGVMHRIYVIGDGEEAENLQKMVSEQEVQNTFIFLGKKENPYPYLKQADYFALLSYFEGYGMVLEEAKILGKPIIITDTAAKEAIEGYERKLIISNDEESIYLELKKVVKREILF